MNSTILLETMNWLTGVLILRNVRLDHHTKLVNTFDTALLGVSVGIDYSEFEDKLLDEKGDEWLPLGPSFQGHVSLYVV